MTQVLPEVHRPEVVTPGLEGVTMPVANSVEVGTPIFDQLQAESPLNGLYDGVQTNYYDSFSHPEAIFDIADSRTDQRQAETMSERFAAIYAQLNTPRTPLLPEVADVVPAQTSAEVLHRVETSRVLGRVKVERELEIAAQAATLAPVAELEQDTQSRLAATAERLGRGVQALKAMGQTALTTVVEKAHNLKARLAERFTQPDLDIYDAEEYVSVERNTQPSRAKTIAKAVGATVLFPIAVVGVGGAAAVTEASILGGTATAVIGGSAALSMQERAAANTPEHRIADMFAPLSTDGDVCTRILGRINDLSGAAFEQQAGRGNTPDLAVALPFTDSKTGLTVQTYNRPSTGASLRVVTPTGQSSRNLAAVELRTSASAPVQRLACAAPMSESLRPVAAEAGLNFGDWLTSIFSPVNTAAKATTN